MDKIKNLCKLDEIQDLKDDWNGYGAKSFSPKLIRLCKSIIEILQFQPQIFPTGRKSIQFQYELKDRSYLEFEIFEDKVDCLEVPKRRYSDAITSQFSACETDKIKEIVNKFYERESVTK